MVAELAACAQHKTVYAWGAQFVQHCGTVLVGVGSGEGYVDVTSTYTPP